MVFKNMDYDTAKGFNHHIDTSVVFYNPIDLLNGCFFLFPR